MPRPAISDPKLAKRSRSYELLTQNLIKKAKVECSQATESTLPSIDELIDFISPNNSLNNSPNNPSNLKLSQDEHNRVFDPVNTFDVNLDGNFLNDQLIDGCDKLSEDYYPINDANFDNLVEGADAQNTVAELSSEEFKQLASLKLIDIQIKNNSTNKIIQDFQNYINWILQYKNLDFKMPKSYLTLRSNVFKMNVGRNYNLITECCKTHASFLKSNQKEAVYWECPTCQNKITPQDVISSKTASCNFNIKDQLKLLLNKFDLMEERFSEDKIDSIFDSVLYKKIH